MEFLLEKSQKEFDCKLVGLFTQQLAIFPNGSMIRLSDQSIALVCRQNAGMPLRPVVRVIQNSRGEDVRPYEIDLIKQLSVTIIESELEIRRDIPAVSAEDIG